MPGHCMTSANCRALGQEVIVRLDISHPVKERMLLFNRNSENCNVVIIDPFCMAFLPKQLVQATDVR
jgi:hypothetical protein